MYKAVIFDLNGVFLQSELLSKRFSEKFGVTEEDFVAALKEVMGQVRKPNSPPAYSLWEPYFQKWSLDISQKELFDFWFSGEKLVEELVDYSQQLRGRGIKVFILSNNFKERTEFYRNNFPQIFACVDKAYFSWETGFVKPSVAAIKLVLAENNIGPQDCIFFDDSDKNIEVARSVGIRSEKWLNLESARPVIEESLSV